MYEQKKTKFRVIYLITELIALFAQVAQCRTSRTMSHKSHKSLNAAHVAHRRTRRTRRTAAQTNHFTTPSTPRNIRSRGSLLFSTLWTCTKFSLHTENFSQSTNAHHPRLVDNFNKHNISGRQILNRKKDSIEKRVIIGFINSEFLCSFPYDLRKAQSERDFSCSN
jgi:hypothetical protein